jgi:hypothetical protein
MSEITPGGKINERDRGSLREMTCPENSPRSTAKS